MPKTSDPQFGKELKSLMNKTRFNGRFATITSAISVAIVLGFALWLLRKSAVSDGFVVAVMIALSTTCLVVVMNVLCNVIHQSLVALVATIEWTKQA